MKERELKGLYVNIEHVSEYDQVRRRRHSAWEASINIQTACMA